MDAMPRLWHWSPEVLDKALQYAKSGQLTMLDVQVSPDCCCRCPKCDSSCPSRRGEYAKMDATPIVKAAEKMHTRHGEIVPGFVCGIGEPTDFERNFPFLEKLVDATKHIACWTFYTSGNMAPAAFEWLLQATADGHVVPRLQLNSLVPAKIAKAMGIPKDAAGRQLDNVKRLAALTKSNTAASAATSIVLTNENLTEWHDLVEFSLENRLYPIIGGLEESGNATGPYFEKNAPAASNLYGLYTWLEQRWGIRYRMPICPAAIGALPVRADGLVTIEKHFGLSCPWYTMDGEAEMVNCGLFDGNIEPFEKTILRYRRDHRKQLECRLSSLDGVTADAFGACGGNERALLKALSETLP